MTEAVIIIIAAAVIVFAAYRTAVRLRKGGGCCGEHEPTEKKLPKRGRGQSDYPYKTDMKITGMTCANCARRVENALNSTEGVQARVDLNTNTAHI